MGDDVGGCCTEMGDCGCTGDQRGALIAVSLELEWIPRVVCFAECEMADFVSLFGPLVGFVLTVIWSAFHLGFPMLLFYFIYRTRTHTIRLPYPPFRSRFLSSGSLPRHIRPYLISLCMIPHTPSHWRLFTGSGIF